MANRRVAIDAGIIIWTGRKAETEEHIERRRRCKLLLNLLKEEEAAIVLPAVALSEVLAGVAVNNREMVAAELSRYYHIAPFDARTSVLAAELFTRNHSEKASQRLPRRDIKADALILASAKLAGARQFFTLDSKLQRLAATIMDAPDLPTHDENLFVDKESHGPPKT